MKAIAQLLTKLKDVDGPGPDGSEGWLEVFGPITEVKIAFYIDDKKTQWYGISHIKVTFPIVEIKIKNKSTIKIIDMEQTPIIEIEVGIDPFEE